MLDVCLLGTGGTMPLPQRALTSLIIKYKGKNILIDCGEGTQVMIRKSGFSLNRIDTILITHFHADHISGLPGLLLSIGKSERTEPVRIIGGKGIIDIVKSLCVIAPDLPFNIEYHEITMSYEKFMFDELRIESLRLEHNVPCYGYSVSLDRLGKFQPQKALDLGIPQKMWTLLQKGEQTEYNGKVFLPEQVLGNPRKGLKITYCTDTRPTKDLIDFARNSDLFICEGMYADDSKLQKAILNKHMMFHEAAAIAQQANVRQLWLTHFSPSIKDPNEYENLAFSLFSNTLIPNDLQMTELKFEHENI